MINSTENSIILNKTFTKFSDSFFIEGDVIIPDVKPDVETVIYVDALPVVDNYIVNSGQITLSGSCEFNILYVSEKLPNEIIRISTSIPFKNSFAVDNLTPDSIVELSISPTKISSLILNGRKISVSSELNTTINICGKEEVTFINEVENNDSIKQQKSNLIIPTFLTSEKASTQIKDTAMLNSEQPTIQDILKYDYSIQKEECVISDDKVLLKGELCIKIYYTSDDSINIHIFETTLPFSNFIDVKNINENDTCELKNCVKNISIKLLPDSDDLMRVIEFDANVENSLKVFSNSEIEIIEDIYSTEADLIPQREDISYEITSENISEDITLRGTISIPEDENVKILTSLGRIKSINLEKENNNSILSGIIDVTVIYSVPSNGKINSVSLDMPMEHILSSNIQTLENAKIQSIDVTNAGGEKYDVKIILNIEGYENKKGEISLLRNLEELETPPTKNTGLTIYFVKPEDTLWKIAKRFHTTVEHIAEMNNISNPDVINAGATLII